MDKKGKKWKQNLETNWILFPQICSKMCCGHNVNIYMRNSCETGKGRIADGIYVVSNFFTFSFTLLFFFLYNSWFLFSHFGFVKLTVQFILYIGVQLTLTKKKCKMLDFVIFRVRCFVTAAYWWIGFKSERRRRRIHIIHARCYMHTLHVHVHSDM